MIDLAWFLIMVKEITLVAGCQRLRRQLCRREHCALQRAVVTRRASHVHRQAALPPHCTAHRPASDPCLQNGFGAAPSNVPEVSAVGVSSFAQPQPHLSMNDSVNESLCRDIARLKAVKLDDVDPTTRS